MTPRVRENISMMQSAGRKKISQRNCDLFNHGKKKNSEQANMHDIC